MAMICDLCKLQQPLKRGVSLINGTSWFVTCFSTQTGVLWQLECVIRCYVGPVLTKHRLAAAAHALSWDWMVAQAGQQMATLAPPVASVVARVPSSRYISLCQHRAQEHCCTAYHRGDVTEAYETGAYETGR